MVIEISWLELQPIQELLRKRDLYSTQKNFGQRAENLLCRP